MQVINGDHTLRNSDLLPKFNFSSMTFKALYKLILVFHSSFISIFYSLPVFYSTSYPSFPSHWVHTCTLCFAIGTFCHSELFAMLEEPYSFLPLWRYTCISLAWSALIYLVISSCSGFKFTFKSPLSSFPWRSQTEWTLLSVFQRCYTYF